MVGKGDVQVEAGAQRQSGARASVAKWAEDVYPIGYGPSLNELKTHAPPSAALNG